MNATGDAKIIGFNPSSNGNGAGINSRCSNAFAGIQVSILLLMEMVLELLEYS